MTSEILRNQYTHLHTVLYNILRKSNKKFTYSLCHHQLAVTKAFLIVIN